MKLWKYSIILISVGMLVLSSGVVSAQTINDGQNDVLKTTGATFLTGQSKPEIDIKKITCTIEGTTLTLELEIYGTIQLMSPYFYFATVETTDFQYDVSMIDGNGGAMVTNNAGSDYAFDDPEPVIDEHTISAVFEIQGDTTIVEIFGHATYIVPELLQDWAPDSRGPEGSFDTGGDGTGGDDTGADDTGGDDTGGDDTGDDDTGDDSGTDDNNTSGDSDNKLKKDTPGFELIFVFVAIALLLIIKHKKIKK